MSTRTVARYSESELAVFKEVIEKKLRKAKNEFNYCRSLLEEMTSSGTNKAKGLDDGFSTSENERITEMAARQQKMIHHLEHALLRIHNKSYGICRETGQLINRDRLKAVPHATLCMDAKSDKKSRR